MMRKWTLVSVFAALAVVTWAQPPSDPPLDRESREETESPAERRTRDARRGSQTPEPNAEVRRGTRPAPPDPQEERPTVQREDPAQQTPAASPDISGRRARPGLGEPGPIDLPEGQTPNPRPDAGERPRGLAPSQEGQSQPGTNQPRRELPDRLRPDGQQNDQQDNQENRETPQAARTPAGVGTPQTMDRPIVRPGRTPEPLSESPSPSPSPDVDLPESAQERIRNARERLEENPAPTDGESRPTPGTRRGQTDDDSPGRRPDSAQTPGRTPRASDSTTPPSSSPSPSATETPRRESNNILPTTDETPTPPPADATPFVPADMPDRLRRNGEGATPTPRAGATPDSETTPGAGVTPRAGETRRAGETPAGRTPGSTPPSGTPATGTPRTGTPRAGETPEGATPSPRTSPTPAVSPESGASPTPMVSPSPGRTPRASGEVRRPGQRRDQGVDAPVIDAEDASTESLNQAARDFLRPGRSEDGERRRRDPARAELTPWVTPRVVSPEEAESIDTSARENTRVVLPPGATPTPTPAPERIRVSDPAEFMDNIRNITLAPTPPPGPTPGPTPVPTPPGVTPVPRDFTPERDWTPYPGWRPPNNWRPPTGWVPPGGWSPPPGWEPPREWVPRLRQWGWSHIPRRGWVVPVQWTPPPDFVVPPNWYYLPPNAYDDYGFYDPAEVVVLPGRARPDLVVNINVTEVYNPPPPPQEMLVEALPPPPRPAPPAPPVIPPQMTQVQNVVEVLSRPREPNAPRYDGPVLVTGSVHLDYDSYAIQPDSFPTLDAIGMALTEEMPDAIINIEGHTDADGSDEYNQNLSEQRAWSVKSYLVQKFGIDPNRLITVGYGERAPIADNTSDAGKAMNRRAEFENVTDLYSAQVIDVETAVPAPGATEY